MAAAYTADAPPIVTEDDSTCGAQRVDQSQDIFSKRRDAVITVYRKRGTHPDERAIAAELSTAVVPAQRRIAVHERGDDTIARSSDLALYYGS